MFLNGHYKYIGMRGKHSIELKNKQSRYTGYSSNDSLELTIVEKGPFEIYEAVINSDPNKESIALEFASIDVENNDEIIKFCDKYGQLFYDEYNTDEYNNNDYIFNNQSELWLFNSRIIQSIEDEKSKRNRLSNYDPSLSLSVFKECVITVKTIVQLSNAIYSRDAIEIIKTIIWFCFKRYDYYDDDELAPSTEFMRVNFYYRCCIYDYIASEDLDVSKLQYYSDAIHLFINKMAEDFKTIEDEANSKKEYLFGPSINHYDMYNQTWKSLYKMMTRLLEKSKIKAIDDFRNIEFDHDITPEEWDYIVGDKNEIINLGYSLLIDFYNDNLFRIKPKLVYSEGKLIPEISIPSLMEFIYIDLFFMNNEYTSFRKCENPTCDNIFQVSNSNSKRMYCSSRCAIQMAKRKQRMREKKKLEDDLNIEAD